LTEREQRRIEGEKRGRVLAVRGTVVDVAFEPGTLPSIGDAVTCHLDHDRSVTAIVHAHLAEGAARTVAVGSTRGLRLGNEVRHAGGPLSIPVGDMLLGRVVDLEGRPLDGGPPFPRTRRGCRSSAPGLAPGDAARVGSSTQRASRSSTCSVR